MLVDLLYEGTATTQDGETFCMNGTFSELTVWAENMLSQNQTCEINIKSKETKEYHEHGK